MKRVLVVDDDFGTTTGLGILLELDGYEVFATDSPTRALAKLESEPFDAVVTDLEMPGVHGVEIVRAAQRAQPGMLVFVMTGYFGSPVCDVALQEGARRIFGKPIEYDALLSELAQELGVPARTLLS